MSRRSDSHFDRAAVLTYPDDRGPRPPVVPRPSPAVAHAPTPGERERYGVALEAAIGWRPVGEFHLVAVDVTEVGHFRMVDGGHDTRA